MEWLDDLDQAWVAVLQAQIWNPGPSSGPGRGEDLVVDVEDVIAGGGSIKSTPMSITDRTRLKSLLLGGVTTLEEWLEGKPIGVNRQFEADDDDDDGLNDIFSNTLEELGGLGVVALEPEECSMNVDD